MQAVILVGGEGTRMRPLTQTVPKPVMTLVDRPLIVFMLEWLREHGVDDVVLCCGFLPTSVESALGDGSALGLRLRCIAEPEPLGTGGALKFAEALLDERFLMLNGDVLTDLDLSAQIDQHERTGATGTLALVGVDDPTAYGLVRMTPSNAVTEFVEKPRPDEVDTNLISAGAYVLERSVLDLIPGGRNVSIEREVWPALVGDGLYGCPSDAYWLDVGTPDRYLQATFDIITGAMSTRVADRLGDQCLDVADGAVVDGRVIAPALIEAGCRIDAGAEVGSLVVLGAGVHVGPGARIERSVVMTGAQIGADCVLCDCIVAPGVHIGPRTRLGGGAVLGEGVMIGTDNEITNGARISAGVSLPDRAVRFS
jgi:mannose-1-phosphate guanylyltransferase